MNLERLKKGDAISIYGVIYFFEDIHWNALHSQYYCRLVNSGSKSIINLGSRFVQRVGVLLVREKKLAGHPLTKIFK
jgi:hypothetical protein